MYKIAIMGFGNPCRSDDGIGCYVIEKLRQYIEPDDQKVTLFDMGTSAFEILFNLKNHTKIIIVDAVLNSDEPDGTIFKLPASEINAAIVDDPMVFLHSLKWDQALSYAKKIMVDDYPDDINVYLIAVNNTKIEVELSEVVKDAGDKVVEYIRQEIC